MRKLGRGTGEYGVKVYLSDYHKKVLPKEIQAVTKEVCARHHIPVPAIDLFPHARLRWGFYYPLDRRITLNRPVCMGVLLHELTHHIINCKSPFVQLHGKQFKNTLQREFNRYGIGIK